MEEDSDTMHATGISTHYYTRANTKASIVPQVYCLSDMEIMLVS